MKEEVAAMNKKDSYTSMDDPVPQRPTKPRGSKSGPASGRFKKAAKKQRAKKAAKKSAKKA